METIRERRAAEVFMDALGRADLDERRAFLEEVCASDQELRRAVDRLLAADASDNGFGEAATRLRTVSAASSAADTLQAGPRHTASPDILRDSISGYTILREIHRGGQGVVYQAIQKSTNRKVAIKVLREGPFAGPSDRARFEREVRVLGQLGHPNIVAIHDSGSAAGQFYFVMDYVAGQPLDVYMTSGPRTIHQTLELFLGICDAVNAAHLRGIIHRDLKPGNICVDTEGQPRVLDFGLAKLASTDGEVEAMTMTGQFLGSLPWAAPEQAEGQPGKIDLRTDVYSLGVILYQMLTGRFPYEVVGAMRDVLDRIMTAEPVRPGSIRRQVNDEVETIVLKCLAKDRDRRYQSAGELARDIRRYLAGEPIDAKRDSGWYVLRKYLRRHRMLVATGCAFLMLIVAGLAAVTKYWREAVANETAAITNQRKAERHAEKAEFVGDFLSELLSQADPNRSGQPDPSPRVSDLLDRSIAQLDDPSYETHPESEAQLRKTIASAYSALGEYKSAIAQFEAAEAIMAHGGEFTASNVADVKMRHGQALLELGDVRDAAVLLREANSAFQADADNDPIKAAVARGNYAHLLGRVGEEALAEGVYREVIATLEQKLGVTNLETASAKNRFAALLIRLGRFDEAEQLLMDALAVRDALLPRDHPERVTCRTNLAEVQLAQRKYSLAEQNADQAALAARRTLGPDHPYLATALMVLGSARLADGRPAEAEPDLREALRIRRGYLDSRQWRVASAEGALGECLAQLGNTIEAEELLRQASESLADDDTASLIRRREALDRLTRFYVAQGRTDDAELWKTRRASLK